MQTNNELQLLIDKYKKEWDANGMGSGISYSKLISDLKSINNLSDCERQPVSDNEQTESKCECNCDGDNFTIGGWEDNSDLKPT